MYVLACRSFLPQLRLVPGAVACLYDDQVTLLPVSTTEITVMTAERLEGGGYGVILSADGFSTVVAQYPSRRLACRQLRRLVSGTSWSWINGLVRTGIAVVLLFSIWFLFFLPGDPSTLSVTVSDNGQRVLPVTPHDPVTPLSAPVSAAPVSDEPAFIDDPATPVPPR